MITDINEQALLFGQSRSLVGIVAHPSHRPSVAKPAVVILNTGIVHRIGHHRMYVTLARRLASLGHDVLRFDLSGIGDSRSRGGTLDPISGCCADVASAIDHLQRSSGVGGFILVGLCSGADIALRYATTDPRVVGLVLLDPTVPPTARFYVGYIIERLTRLRSWLTFASGRGRVWRDIVSGLRSLLAAKPSQRDAGQIDTGTPAELAKSYASIVDDETKILVVTTADDGRQSYREQLLDAFPNVQFEGRLRLEHFENADHIFSDPADRVRLNDLIVSWLAETQFGRASQTVKQVASAAS